MPFVLLLLLVGTMPIGQVFYEKTKEGLEGPRGEAFEKRPEPPPPFLKFDKAEKIVLPEPFAVDMTLFEALLERRSRRSYSRDSLDLRELSNLLFAGQGITVRRKKFVLRASPSAGALYPIELFIAVKRIKGLSPGLYHYSPEDHSIEYLRKDGKLWDRLYRASLWQRWVYDAAAVIIVAGVVDRTRAKYSERGWRYVFMEAGHTSQNLYLMATALGLGTVAVGAFADDEVSEILKVPGTYPLYLQPVGKISR